MPVIYTSKFRPAILKYGDYVTFEITLPDKSIRTLDYLVERRYLFHKGDNCEIFKVLDIDKLSYCKSYYGYDPHVIKESPDFFPEYKSDDFAAACRLVHGLFSRAFMLSMRNLEKYDKAQKEPMNFKEACSTTNNNNNLNDGKIIKITRIAPAVIRGKETLGCRISGKTSRTSTTSRHLSHTKIFG